MTPYWKFRVMSRGEMNADPIAGEFFTTDHLDSITDALVREVIQNSLDAAVPGETVTVRFRIVGRSHGNASLFERYFASLSPHLAAEQNGLSFQPSLHDPMPYLVIEDFGTRGLEGDFRVDSDLERYGAKNDFFYFWRNVGRSGKTEGDRGRWGLGKTVYQAASRMNAFLGISTRRSDGSRLLMGQATLKTHVLNGRKYYPYGWYGLFEGDFALPVQDADTLRRFCADFSVDRAEKPGLSVVVPYPDPSITALRLIASVLIHYFFPIVGGTLAVEVIQGDLKPRIISRDTVDSLLEQLEIEQTHMNKKRLRALLAMSQWVHGLNREDHVVLRPPNPARAAEWDESLVPEKRLAATRAAFEAGQPIAVRVPMKVQRPHHGGQEASFSVYLQRDESLEQPEDHFVRDGITIAGVKSLRTKGVRALVVVDDPVLSAMLGDAENPAHTEWQERSPKFRGKYVRGASALRFVKNSPRELVRILSAPPKGKDESLLRDLFFVTVPAQPSAPEGGQKKGREGQGGSDAMDAAGYGQGRYLLVVPVKTGFRVSGDRTRPLPTRYFMLSAAYLIRRGDPFARYSPLDFELDKPPLAIKPRNVRIHRVVRNRIYAEAAAEAFSLELTGFDPNRDIIVRADLIEALVP